MVIINPARTDRLISALAALWEASVRATHHFLTEEDVQKLIPFVTTGLSDIETLIVVYDDGGPTAFMGVDGDKIEMLFVAPDYFGRGVGGELARLGMRQYGVQYVDVNEQNPEAAGFYRHIGFEVFERMELDERGNAFPILKMKLRSFLIRQAVPHDAASLIDLYRNTVLAVNRRDYSQAEVEDWASCGEIPKCEEMIKTHYFIVAETFESQIVGFSSITPQGYLHSMFVHKDFQSKGVATMLLNEIERYAKENGITKITSEVSLTARPFFERRGYAVETEQKRQANKLSLTNFWMVKAISRIKPYHGRVPSCGVFCGGCPTYTRERNPCPGAEKNKARCEKCKTFHLCCVEKGITHCYQCNLYPCGKFRNFAKRWSEHGQNFIENQKLLAQIGETEFIRVCNNYVIRDLDSLCSVICNEVKMNILKLDDYKRSKT